MFGNLVKGVIDIEKETLVIDADLHSDQEAYLLGKGSRQEDLWGINLYPDLPIDQMIEFDSMINIRPSQGNSTRGVEDKEIQERIIEIVKPKIKT